MYSTISHATDAGSAQAERRSDRERRLAISERRYRSLIDAVPAQAVWVASPTGETLEYSPRFRAFTGQSVDEFRDFGWMNALHPDDRARTEEIWADALRGKTIYQTEYRLRGADGVYRWFAAYGVPVLENGEVVEWVGTVTDIHDKKLSEERSRFLLEANEQFASTLDERTLIERLAKIVVPLLADWCAIDMVGDDGQLVLRSVEHRDSAKLEALKTLLRRHGNGAIPPVDAEVIRDARPGLLRAVPDELLSSWSTDDDGLELMRTAGLESVMVVPMSVRGVVIGVLRLVSGQSHRRFTREDLGLASNLAARAAVFIDNARLYADAANANRARDIFLAKLSHEMKTPLTAILGWTRMLRAEGASSDLFDEALEAVEQSARVQQRLIDDVLDVSRVMAGKLHIEKHDVKLSSTIASAVEMVTPVARQNDVHIRTHGDSDVTVCADETRLRQIVWNLLTNAVKFTPAGGFIEIETRRDGDRVHMVVRDSGRGIRPDSLPHLFDQFHQTAVADRARHGGLGLGLAIVRNLVEAHGGTVEAHSEGEGKGSEFVVTLPLSEAA